MDFKQMKRLPVASKNYKYKIYSKPQLTIDLSAIIITKKNLW